MTDRTQHTLLGTDDAMVWAEEFCRIFNGRVIMADAFNPAQHAPVDPGVMVTWFVNAMQTAIDHYERKALAEKELGQRVEELPDDDDEEEQDPTGEITLEESFLEGFNEGRPNPS